LRSNGGVGARRRRDLKWALRAAPYPSASRPPFPSRERIEAKAPANPILPLGEVSRRDGGAGARSAEVFAHWRSHPLRPRLRLWLRRAHFPACGEDIHAVQICPILSLDPCRGRRELSLFGHGCTGRVCRPCGVISDMTDSTRVREALNPCSCIHIRFHRPSACLSLQRESAWRFWCFPRIALAPGPRRASFPFNANRREEVIR